MGVSSSKRSSRGSFRGSHGDGATDRWVQHGSTYNPRDQYYTPQHRYAPPPPSSSGYGAPAPQRQKGFERKYSRIADNYGSLDEVRLLSSC